MRSSHAAVLIAFVLLGAAGGLGMYTFVYARGWSYLTDDPRACANCHVMNEQYDGWLKASHRSVAVCNDCHLSRHPIGKWVVKADNGFFHSLAFTLDNFHEPIQIKPRNRRVAENSCLHCHEELVHEILAAQPEGERMSCIHCHADVGHALR